MSTPRVTADTFNQQMTATLKAKKVKNMGDLVKHYKSITEALDDTGSMGLADSGQKNYESAKNLTLRFKKRGQDFDELKKLWGNVDAQGHEDESGKKETKQQEAAVVPASAPGANIEIQQAAETITEIKSDKDLAILLSSMIQEAFYNPETGLWPKYDASFDRQSYISLAKAGWEKDKEGAARENVNKKKNSEVSKLLESEFALKVVESVFDHIRMQVYDVKKKEVRHGVRNHVRFHLYSLIYKDL